MRTGCLELRAQRLGVRDCVSSSLNTQPLQPDVQLSQQLELVYQIIVFTKLTGSIPSTLSFPHNRVVCLFISVFEDFDGRLSQFPQFNFFSLSVFFLMLSCVYALCTLCLSSFHHDDHACVLLCILLSTYSAASGSLLRNFLTGKFLSEEFIKIAYSPPPSSRYNALSIDIRARYSLVLCDFGLTAWSFSYVDRRYDQGLCWVSYLRWDGLPLLEE